MSEHHKLDAASITDAFRAVLLRSPESADVVAHYLKLGLSFHELLTALIESDEFRERQRRLVSLADLPMDAPALHRLPAARSDGARVLLFGAYGNGNVGDMAQAAALADLIRGLAPRPPGFAATSWERRHRYTPKGIQVLRSDALLRPEHIRPRLGPRDGGGADLVVIGGGGLLGAPHYPLHERRWTDWFVAREVPFALIGVGGSAGALAEPGWRDAYQTLLRNAAFVGVRDDETLQAARATRPDASWFPDPILAQALLAHEADAGGHRPLDAVLIPREPNNAADAAALRGLLALAAELRGAGRRVVIASLEPDTDRRALASEQVQYIETWGELMALCGDTRVVLSARFHGAIAGLAAGCTVHGLAQPKIGDLMARLGVEAWFHRSGWPAARPELTSLAAAQFQSALAPGIAAFRTALEGAMRRLRTAIGPALEGPPGTARTAAGR